MKETTKNSGALQGLRGKQVSVTLIALICTTVLVWGWERTPIAGIFPAEYRGPVRTLVRPGNQQDNQLDISGPTTMAMPSVEKSPSILAEDLHSQSVAELPVQKLPAVSAEELPVQKLPPVSAEELPVQKLPDVPAEKPPASSAEESLGEKSQFPTSENSPSTEKKGCDYTEGKWVHDASRPLYSGRGCKRWLSEMWACRLMQRTEFSYEKFRWQPDNCDMPEFEGQQILRRMQNKTLAFIGDSLGRQQFQSMMCLITGGVDRPDVEDVGKKYGLVRARGAIRPDGWAYRFPETNTTILYYWSASLCAIEPLNWTDTSTDFAMHLDRPAGFLRDNLHRFDVVILNTGHHWNRGKLNANRWRMFVNGQPNNDRNLRDIRSAQNFTVHSVVKWLDKQLGNYPQLRAFMRTISPRHFFNGDWDSGGRCDNTTPLSGIKNLLQKPAHDPVVESAVKGTQVELLDITGVSQLRDEAHISKYSLRAKNGFQDCLHWCLPGVPDTWNELLFAQLLLPQQKNRLAQF